MKSLMAFVLVFLIAFTSPAQEAQTRNLSSFTGVKVAEGIDVYLKKGDKESARVEVYGTRLDNVITEVSGSYLKVHMREENRGHVNVKVYVTYVKVDKLSASSAGSIFSEGTIDANSMEISSSSAANIEIALNATGEVEISSSSAGEVEVKGKANSLRAEASSAGEIDAYDLEAKKVNAEASSAGSIKVNVTSELDAHASSGGSIRYRGNPDMSNTNSSSGGSVKKSN
jgi:hypothetical protein